MALLRIYNRRISLENGNVKDVVKMANKWHSTSVVGRITPFIRPYLVVFDVPVLILNLSNDNFMKHRGFNDYGRGMIINLWAAN